MQAKDALTHGTLGQPAGKADVDTGPGRKGIKFAELPSYSQSSEKASYGGICVTARLHFTKESLTQSDTWAETFSWALTDLCQIQS